MAPHHQYLARGIAALALAAGAVLGTAAPAQAAAMDCMLSLVEAGYAPGPKSHAACIEGEQWDGHPRCVDQLLAIGVDRFDADQACSRAAG